MYDIIDYCIKTFLTEGLGISALIKGEYFDSAV
jgi:hypothetical protein